MSPSALDDLREVGKAIGFALFILLCVSGGIALALWAFTLGAHP